MPYVTVQPRRGGSHAAVTPFGVFAGLVDHVPRADELGYWLAFLWDFLFQTNAEEIR